MHQGNKVKVFGGSSQGSVSSDHHTKYKNKWLKIGIKRINKRANQNNNIQTNEF